jgi:hypothetical protein
LNLDYIIRRVLNLDYIIRTNNDGFTHHSLSNRKVTSFKGSTGRLFHFIGNIHDLESFAGIDNAMSLSTKIFA